MDNVYVNDRAVSMIERLYEQEKLLLVYYTDMDPYSDQFTPSRTTDSQGRTTTNFQSSCRNCLQFHDGVIATDEFRSWVGSHDNFAMVVVRGGHSDSTISSYRQQIVDFLEAKVGGFGMTHYPYGGIVRKGKPAESLLFQNPYTEQIKVYDSSTDSTRPYDPPVVINSVTNLIQILEQRYTSAQPPVQTGYLVTFADRDGRILKSGQYVQAGQAAIPPTTPTLDGYVFTGWSPDYKNVNSDRICMAQYLAVDRHSSHTITMSDTLSSLRVIGDNKSSNALKEKLLNVVVGSNVNSLENSCFIDCENLLSATLPVECKYIGDYAFKGCKSLEYVNVLNSLETPINFIGAHAFDGCENLDNVVLNLSSSYVSTGMGEYSFANCTGLTRFEQRGSSYMSPYMLSGCTSLQSIVFPKNTNYVYEYALEGIPNIKSVTLPNNIWFMSEGMFTGCSSLTSVTIEDSGNDKSVMNMVESKVFDGCRSLTSITLPESIDSITCLNQTWLSGSSIQRVICHGIPDNEFADETVKYTKLDAIDKSGYILTKNNYKKLIPLIRDSHVPVVIVTQKQKQGEKDNKSCSWCTKLHAVLASSAWKKFMKDNANRILFIYAAYELSPDYWGWFGWKEASTTKNPLDQYITYTRDTGYAQLHFLWHKPDGKWLSGTDSNWKSYDIKTVSGKAEAAIAHINKYFSKSTVTFAPSETVYTQNTKLDKFGSGLDSVTFVSKSGHEYKVVKDTQVIYQPEVRVNRSLTDKFQYGVWYYNARELKEYADKNNIPVFYEYGDRGCDPCKKFRINIYNNVQFQNFVSSSPYLFCKIETDKNTEYSDPSINPQAYFIYNEWTKTSPNYHNEQIPVIGFYWRKYGQTTPEVWDISSYHFNPKAAGSQPPFTMEELSSAITEKFGSYQRNPAFNPTIISTLYSDDGVIVGRIYDNVGTVDYDDSGIYFGCDEKTSLGTGRFNKTINVSISKPPYPTYIQKGQTVNLPVGTYQYYSTPASKEYNYDKEGCIFRVDKDGSNNVVQYLYKFENDYDDDTKPQKYFFNRWYELSNDSDADIFNEIITESEDIDARVVMIRSDDTQESKDLDAVLSSETFTQFMDEQKTPETYYIRVRQTDWTKGVGRAMSSCICADYRSVDDDGRSWHWDDTIPKIFMYNGCQACSEGTIPDIRTAADLNPNGKTVDQIIEGINDRFRYY